MKFTYNWLREYVAFDWSPRELAERLTMAGLEVENVATLGGNLFDEIVVGEIRASEKHPNADRLSVCRVTDGQEELQIVCGATNYRVGDKIALARVGVTLPGEFTIKQAKLRGVESHGMMCSAQELDLADDADGLLILPSDTAVGVTLTEALGGPDTVYEVEVTPNRPDWLSVTGIAREIAAITGATLNQPQIRLPNDGIPVNDLTKITVEAGDLCPRYTARVIEGVRIGPSPAWLRQLLEKVGLRSINNVVDITNYVLLETGHPLHAFDYELLSGHQIVVRRALPGEMFTAIDDSQHELTEEHLVIADADRAVALAGIMGGQNSEIHDGTATVLLESAWFDPANIRRTSRQLGLASESSYRFERGTDIEGVVRASDRAATLICELAGGKLAQGIIDTLASPVNRRTVTCRYGQVNRLLGIEMDPSTVENILTGLGLEPITSPAGSTPADPSITVRVPTFRPDLEREVDLIEEICRIHGADRIPAQMSPARTAVSAFDPHWDRLCEIRQIMSGLGFDEAVNQTMVGDTHLPGGGGTPSLRLQNPLTAELTALRGSLLPGLLENLRTNIARHQYDVRLFEIGRIFAADGTESLRLGLALTGRQNPTAWEAAARSVLLDYHDLRGALDEMSGRLGIPLAPPIETITPAAARKLGLRDAVYLAELDLAPVLEAPRAEIRFRERSRFPAVERDIALIVDASVTHENVLAVFTRQAIKILEGIELFDIFQGDPIPKGKKSMAYALTYRAAERTLTDDEVNRAHDKLKRQVQRDLACELRES